MELEREEAALGAGGSSSPDSVRVAAFEEAGLRVACLSSSVSLAIVTVEALRRPKSSDGRVRLEFVVVVVFVVGLVPRPPLQVAEAGNRGGAISPDLWACEEDSVAF